MTLSTAHRTYTPEELAALERATGLRVYGWLWVPPTLLPVLGAPHRDAAARRRIVLALHRAGLPVTPERPQEEIPHGSLETHP